jgi:hypothetical protein
MISVTISTSPNPDLAGSQDQVINLNTGDTLPQDVNLYAVAVDSDDSVANFTYSWHLLRKPSGSGVLLSDAQIQNPVLEGVDVWGDYRLFCIATNTSTQATSEADPIKAGNSAFCQVRVRSQHLALVKPAAGERDWFTFAYEWVDAIEAFDPLIDDHEERITVLEAAGAATTFDALTDTDFNTLLDGQVAQYNSSTGNWENVTLALGSSTLLLADTDSSVSLPLATERLGLKGTSNIEVDVASVASGKDFTFTLADQVNINDTLTVGGLLTAEDEISAQQSINALSDIYVTGRVMDSASPYTYLIGKADGWYMSDDGTAGAECKLLTRCQEPGTTTTTRGGVIKSTDKWSSSNSDGTLPSVHILHYSQIAEHTVYTNDAADQPHVDSNDDTINASQTGVTQITSHSHFLFKNQTGREIYLTDLNVTVLVGGDHQGQPYVWELIEYQTTNDLLTLNANNTGITLTASQNGPWQPSVAEYLNLNYPIPDGGYFGFRCVQSAKIEGHRAVANVTAIRLI